MCVKFSPDHAALVSGILAEAARTEVMPRFKALGDGAVTGTRRRSLIRSAMRMKPLNG
jgi:hypothetical protein